MWRMLDRRQCRAVLDLARAELAWVLPSVRDTLAGWQRLASRIPDASLRRDALVTLRRERLNFEGAALFAVLAPRHRLELLRCLVAFQLLLDVLDTLNERPAPDMLANGRRLQAALPEALDPSRPITDHLAAHPAREDGGFVRAIVEHCRAACRRLPRYDLVAERATLHARRLDIQVINHDPDLGRRERAMAAWARAEFPDEDRLAPWELAAAASATLQIHALLALAADPRTTPETVAAVDDAYFPWVNAATTLLDAYVDQPSDRAAGNHNYVERYGGTRVAGERLAEIVREAVTRASALPRGDRHAVIVSGMVAMYLSHEAARSPELRASSRAIRRAAGPLQLVQVPVLRALRAAHGVRSA